MTLYRWSPRGWLFPKTAVLKNLPDNRFFLNERDAVTVIVPGKSGSAGLPASGGPALVWSDSLAGGPGVIVTGIDAVRAALFTTIMPWPVCNRKKQLGQINLKISGKSPA